MSPVEICNLALSYLGDVANVQDISPPDKSAQAEHCARYYPIARDGLLEMHQWGFATKRATLAPLANAPRMTWRFAYMQPQDALNIIAILPNDVTDDYTESIIHKHHGFHGARYVPQSFACEMVNGCECVLTDQENAVCRYTARIEDAAKFSPLFTITLAYHLASMLAGSLLKGDTGAKMAQAMGQAMQTYLTQAIDSDMGQRQIKPTHSVPWIAGR